MRQMSSPIITESAIVVPLTLVPIIEELTKACAIELGEDIEQARRAVEIAILQCGIAAVRRNTKANRALALRMGWPRSDGDTP